MGKPVVARVGSLLLLTLCGCGQSPDWDRVKDDAGRTLDDAQQQTREALEDARRQASQWKKLSEEEIQKLWAVEYKTIHISGSDTAVFDVRLNDLGKERWECYHVTEATQGKVFYLKRPAASSLRYLPLRDLLRVVLLLGDGNG